MRRRAKKEQEVAPPIFGRSAARDLVTRHVFAEAPSPPLICFWGVTRVGKTSLLSRIVHDQRREGQKALLVDLAEHGTSDQVAERLRTYLRRQRRWWLLTRFVMIKERIDEDRPSDARTAAFEAGATAARMLVQSATGTQPAAFTGTVVTLPTKLWRALRPVGRRLWRREQVRWVRDRTRQLKSSDVPSERRERLRALDALVPEALAADLADLVGRRGIERLVLLFDHHDQAGKTLGAAISNDFVLTLFTALRIASAPITVVVARNAPLEPPPDSVLAEAGQRDRHGALQSSTLVQRRVEPLTAEDAMEFLEYLRVPTQRRQELMTACGRHPYALELAGKSGTVPDAPHRTVPPSDEAMVESLLRRTVDGLMAKRDSEQRRILRIASTVRAFDRGMLDHLVGHAVASEDIDENVRLGVFRSLPEVGSSRVWRVDPVLRLLIARRLFIGDDREIYLDGHRRAVSYLEGLNPPGDHELHFRLCVERLHHLAALDPERGLDELVKLADAELARYRIDHAQVIITAIEDLPGVDQDTIARAVLVRAKLLSDLHAHDAVARILEEAACEHPFEEGPTSTAIAVQLELAKSERLRGRYDESLRRYEKIAEVADAFDLPPVSLHAAWERSLVYKQLDELPKSLELLETARSSLAGMLSEGEATAARAARRYGIRQLDLKRAHMARHEAELHRLGGNYVAAHAAVDHAMELYGHREPRAVLHTHVVRSQILRIEGCVAEALAEAVEVRRASELVVPRDERLYLFSTRAEVLARVTLGDVGGAQPGIAHLLDAEPGIYPSARWSGWLCHGEAQRREGRVADAEASYRRAAHEARRLHNQAGRATALLGLLECRRATGSPSAAELEVLLALPCLKHEPWLELRAQLCLAILRPAQRADALLAATAIADHQFVRRDGTPDRDRSLVDRVRAELEVGAATPIALEVL